MNKKTIKILSILLTFVMVITMMSTPVFAADGDAAEEGGLSSPSGLTPSTGGNGTAQIQNLGEDLIGLLQTAGIVVAVVVLIVLGIKYMMGSTAEKAEYKKTMMPYFVGAILIFGAVAVAEVVFQFANGLTATEEAAEGAKVLKMITGIHA